MSSRFPNNSPLPLIRKTTKIRVSMESAVQLVPSNKVSMLSQTSVRISFINAYQDEIAFSNSPPTPWPDQLYFCSIFNLYRWHRVAISMQKGVARLLVDCQQREYASYDQSTFTFDDRGRLQLLKDGIQVSLEEREKELWNWDQS